MQKGKHIYSPSNSICCLAGQHAPNQPSCCPRVGRWVTCDMSVILQPPTSTQVHWSPAIRFSRHMLKINPWVDHIPLTTTRLKIKYDTNKAPMGVWGVTGTLSSLPLKPQSQHSPAFPRACSITCLPVAKARQLIYRSVLKRANTEEQNSTNSSAHQRAPNEKPSSNVAAHWFPECHEMKIFSVSACRKLNHVFFPPS